MAVGRSVCCRENQPRRLGRSIRDVFAEALSLQTGSPSTKPCAPSRNDARGPTRRHTHRPGGRRLSARPHRQPVAAMATLETVAVSRAAGVCEVVCAASGTRLRPPDEDEILAETGLDPRGLKTTPKLRNPAAPVCAPRFKSPPGAADNERKRLSLLQGTLRPRPLVPSAGSLLYQAYSTGYLHRRRLLLPARPSVARAFRPAPLRPCVRQPRRRRPGGGGPAARARPLAATSGGRGNSGSRRGGVVIHRGRPPRRDGRPPERAAARAARTPRPP
jgi:hypothetical protein